MAEATNIWWGLLLGLGAGLLSGTLGLGSGTLLVPAMVVVMGFPQKSAQGAALAAMVPMALLGALLYWRSGDLQVPWAAVALIAAAAMGGSVLGTRLAHVLPAATLRKVFAVFLLIVGLRMMLLSARAPCPLARNGSAGREEQQHQPGQGKADVRQRLSTGR